VKKRHFGRRMRRAAVRSDRQILHGANSEKSTTATHLATRKPAERQIRASAQVLWALQ